MGNPIYEYDNETRLVHFCLHFEIKDKMPEAFDKVGGTWYVKEPGEIGTRIPSTSATMTPPPPGIPTLVWSYFYRQLATGGHWEGWKIVDIQYKDVASCFDVVISKKS